MEVIAYIAYAIIGIIFSFGWAYYIGCRRQELYEMYRDSSRNYIQESARSRAASDAADWIPLAIFGSILWPITLFMFLIMPIAWLCDKIATSVYPSIVELGAKHGCPPKKKE